MSEKENFFKRLQSTTRYLVSGVKPDTWFSPLQPINPVAQQAEGRQFDYMSGYNILIQPRSEEIHGFKELRLLAENCDILRAVIETRKDQIGRFKYTFKLKNSPNKVDDDRCQYLQDFFASPDKRHTFDEWVRAIAEDLFVIDAPTILPRFTRGGQLYSLELMDGSTIKPLIDENGRIPIEEDSVAYQQNLKGVPAVDYSYKELIYRPKNIRTYKVYGNSPVEQIITTVNTQIRKQLQQLSYFTEGNTPNLIFSTPENWNPDQIKMYQRYWDEINMNGSKSNSKFVPYGVEPYNTKPEPLKTEFDEWLARIICYHFGVSAQPFIKELNRSTSETSAAQAVDDGLLPTMQWFKNLFDYIIITYFGYTDIEFEWDRDIEPDPKIKAEIDKMYIDAGVKTVNEVRKEMGLDPIETVNTEPKVKDKEVK